MAKTRPFSYLCCKVLDPTVPQIAWSHQLSVQLANGTSSEESIIHNAYIYVYIMYKSFEECIYYV
jgi:hypothetical protein